MNLRVKMGKETLEFPFGNFAVAYPLKIFLHFFLLTQFS